MLETAIFSRLSADAGVLSNLGGQTRIYPVSLPQSPTIPALAYTRVSAFERQLHHGGAANFAEARIQFSCFGNTPLEAKNLAIAVRNALHGFSGTVGSEKIFWARAVNEVDLFDPDLGYQVALDIIFAYAE